MSPALHVAISLDLLVCYLSTYTAQTCLARGVPQVSIFVRCCFACSCVHIISYFIVYFAIHQPLNAARSLPRPYSQPQGRSLLLLPGLRQRARPLPSSSSTMLPLHRLPQVRQQPRGSLRRDYANVEKLSQHIKTVMRESHDQPHPLLPLNIFVFSACSAAHAPPPAMPQQASGGGGFLSGLMGSVAQGKQAHAWMKQRFWVTSMPPCSSSSAVHL